MLLARLAPVALPIVIGAGLCITVSACVPGASAQETAERPDVRRDRVEWADSGAVHATILRPAMRRPSLPTLLFSPGFGQTPEQYSTLLAAWARHGYMIVAVEHPVFAHAATVELYEAQRVIARQLVRAVEHIIRDRSRPGSPFSRVDPQRVGIAGHSVGGGAAAQACAWEPRVRAGVNLDGTIFGDVVHTGMRQPFLLVQQRAVRNAVDQPRFIEYHDRGTLHEDSVFAHAATMYWLTVDRLDHMAFTDRALSPTLAERMMTVVGLRRSAAATQELTTEYVLAFLDHYLDGEPFRAPLLSPSPFPGTTVRIKSATAASPLRR